MNGKTLFLVVLSFAILFWPGYSLCSQGLALPTNSTGSYHSSIRFDGLERTYRIHIPHSFDRNKPAPLVLALHGGGGSSERMVSLTLGGFSILSEREGFIVVYPEAFENNWNDGRGLLRYRSHREDIDDVGFISALIDHLAVKFNIDKKRVYVTGMSNGAIMSYRLACQLTDKIAAVAPVAGLMPEKLPVKPSPSRPISVLMINNVDDQLVPWKGGYVRFRSQRLGKVLSVPKVVKYWVIHNKCSSEPVITQLADKDPNDGTRVQKTVYKRGKDGAEVILYTVEGGGHTWPGGMTYRNKIIGKTSKDINASEVIWNFFKHHSLK